MAESGIEQAEFADRLARVRQHARQHGWQGVVVVGRPFYDRPGNLAYLSNHFPPFPTAAFSNLRRGTGHAILVVPLEAEPTLLTDGSYRSDLVVISRVRSFTDLVDGLATTLREAGLRASVVGLAGEDIVPHLFIRHLQALLPDLRLESADAALNALRRRKSPAEQELLRAAARIADLGLQAAIEAAKPGVTEAHICAVGTAAALEAGADFVRYFRVQGGAWSAHGSRWPQAMQRTVEAGELIYLDIIGASCGYGFDVLRTVVAGEPSARQREVLDATHRTLDALIREARPGVPAGNLARRCGQLLGEAGLGGHAARFVGHGIGLETVEDPILVPEDGSVLEADMVLCIEPHVLIPEWGGCAIEQEVILHTDGPEVITHCPTRWW